MENFNLKKFLVENKLTPNSRLLSENVNRATFYKGLKQELADVEVGKEEIQAIIHPENGLGKFEEGKWIQSGMESKYRQSYSDADELDGIIAEYCESIGVEFEEEARGLIEKWYFNTHPQADELSQEEEEAGVEAHFEEWNAVKDQYDSIEDYFEDVERQGDWY